MCPETGLHGVSSIALPQIAYHGSEHILSLPVEAIFLRQLALTLDRRPTCRASIPQSLNPLGPQLRPPVPVCDRPACICMHLSTREGMHFRSCSVRGSAASPH